ncbi:LysR family transcriptional regulator [Pontibacterium granulatum]|uniref:winged helix-turn-helix domain-containing protein n=1 Tax=Pontibacterium granulatum TaxID=2036029 RepID=UPI00249B8DE5|nr:LysR family transcriptional regulator [Pontibacterium granulatum]MDI3324439.1 LysR family transcriptional regulator [Pontibacterium granulatum]
MSISAESDVKLPKLKARIRLQLGEDIALGPGKVELLELIQETGSISAAARRMGMSYRRAWLLVETMNRCFASPLVETAQGGKGGGGAGVSEVGRQVLALYHQLEAKLQVSEEIQQIVQLVAQDIQSD